MKIKLKELHIENFKGCKDRTIQFGDTTKISGMNAAGKTTIADAWFWVLFGKNSKGVEKFGVRPVDADGNPVHNVEIKVVALLDVDGNEVELEKVQKEIWRKKRGSDVTELQGNQNSFSINGYPKSEKDYKAYIASLVDEDLFKLITNPSAFSSMPWKKQRDVLMKLVSDVSDADLAREMGEESGKYDALIPELEQASTDDIKAKYTKAMNTWKKKQVEIPARIDEASKQLVDIDVAELELQKSALKEQITETESQLEGAGAAFDDFQKKSDEIFALKKEVSEYRQKAMDKASEERRKIRAKMDGYTTSIRVSDNNIQNSQTEIERLQKTIDWCASDRLDLQKQYKEKKAERFPIFEPLPQIDEDDLFCPTCGQTLPEALKQERIAEYKKKCADHEKKYKIDAATFELKKQSRLADIEAQGKAKVKQIEDNKKTIERLQSGIEDDKKIIAEHCAAKAELEKQLAALPIEADLSDDQVFAEMQLRLQKMEESLNGMDSGTEQRQALKIRLAGLREELSAIEKKIASADNSAVEERIEELKTEQRTTSQKVADQERMICLLEDFVRTKMDKISDKINSKFKTIKWKMFEDQLNGGMAETCKFCVIGVSEGDVNDGDVEVGHLEIISALNEIYGVSAPVFFDNAESVNDWKIPEMNCQMILLKVSDDKELKVEVC